MAYINGPDSFLPQVHDHPDFQLDFLTPYIVEPDLFILYRFKQKLHYYNDEKIFPLRFMIILTSNLIF